MDNAPFKIGQNVVALKNTDYVVKGGVYLVKNIFKHECGNWVIDIGFPVVKKEHICSRCFDCLSKIGGILWLDAKTFTPIEEQREKIRYVAVSETLREKAIEIAAIETN